MADFDVIVVGAGPAGSSAALVLAEAGRSVLLVERGDNPGSKNTSGGRLYTYALETVRPGLTAEAPVERPVCTEQVTMLDGARSVTVSYADADLAHNDDVPTSVTVLRATFDPWLAGRAEAAGAVVATSVQVTDLLESGERVVGVIADGDELTADQVVAADGVNSLLGRRAGVHDELRPDGVAIGAKKVIRLPAETIEERFGLAPGQGAARLLVGGHHGGGAFVYTNRESLSFGVVFVASAIAAGDQPIHEVLAQFEAHPAVEALIGGGDAVEYSAHLVPEAGWAGLPRVLHRPGFLMVGDAAGFVINLGYTVRGMDLALLSGVAAARAVLAAVGDVDAVGAAYERQLKALGVLPALRQARRFPALLDNPRVFGTYPAMAADALHQLFAVTQAVPPAPISGIRRRLRGRVGLPTGARDALTIWRAVS